jgi:RNA polymerase sigma factor (sigma-70 family)
MTVVGETGASQRDATQALWERFHASVYRYALSQLRSPQDAEDATQTTFLRAFNALQRGVVPENEAAWLFKIAHNTCTSSKLAWLRRRRVETPHDTAYLERAPAAEQRGDELEGLGDALVRMPARPREAFLLREWQGLSYAEIAERMQTAQSAVETLIFRARRTLAQQLAPPLRRVRQALGTAPLLATLRGRLGGGSLAVQTVGAAAVVATASVAVTQAVVARRSPARHAPVARTVPAVAHASTRQTPHARPPARSNAVHTGGEAPPASRTRGQAPAGGSRPAAEPRAASPGATSPSPAADGVTPPASPAQPGPTGAPPAPAEPALPDVPDLPPAPAVPQIPPTSPLPPLALPPTPPLPSAPPLPAGPAAPALPQLP